MKITKDELLNGFNNVVDFQPTNSDKTISLRPLTIGEINELEEMKSKALGTYVANETSTSSKRRVKGKMNAQAKINIEKTTIAENKARIKAVMLSVNGGNNGFTLTEEEVNAMDPLVFTEIFEEVQRISHWDDNDLEDDVENFPEDN